MGETDYNALLYDKMKAEQDKYKDWLLSQPPEEILNHTYEYTMREDIVMCIKDALIYDLDETPVETKKWTELDNVRRYFNFFEEHRSEFL